MRWFGYRITGITTAPIVQAPTFVCGHTNRFFQISDLPIEWRRGKEDKQANQIVRFKTSDGKEWLASKQQWIAIDSQGNEITESFHNLEKWDKPEFEYGMIPQDRNNPNGPKVHRVVDVKELKKQYDLPFNQKYLKMLYDMQPSPEPSSVSLSIMKVGYDGNRIDWPYQIEKYEDFANRPFDELWEYVPTPKNTN
jgi:phage repressor protein C with HTH and peptisase S24 domain